MENATELELQVIVQHIALPPLLILFFFQIRGQDGPFLHLLSALAGQIDYIRIAINTISLLFYLLTLNSQILLGQSPLLLYAVFLLDLLIVTVSRVLARLKRFLTRVAFLFARLVFALAGMRVRSLPFLCAVAAGCDVELVDLSDCLAYEGRIELLFAVFGHVEDLLLDLHTVEFYLCWQILSALCGVHYADQALVADELIEFFYVLLPDTVDLP